MDSLPSILKILWVCLTSTYLQFPPIQAHPYLLFHNSFDTCLWSYHNTWRCRVLFPGPAQAVNPEGVKVVKRVLGALITWKLKPGCPAPLSTHGLLLTKAAWLMS